MSLRLTPIKALLGGLIFAAAMVAPTTPGFAKIKCNGAYQVVPGAGEISTPYCEDANLAKVAREYGFKVSGKKVRQDYATKDEICQLIGEDIRVQHACAGHTPNGGSDRGR